MSAPSVAPAETGSEQELLSQRQSQVSFIAGMIAVFRPTIPDCGSVARNIVQLASEKGIDPLYVAAVISIESGFAQNARSKVGATGLMQLMPGTAADMGVDDPFDPEQNIEGGVKYLSLLTDKYGEDKEKILAAYNAGPARVDAVGGIPSIPETQRYVENVMARYRRLKGGG